MKRVMLIISYDGTNYCGWQIQINGITVEEVLNKHLSKLLGEDIAIIGASRTDSGVHALGNVAVFDTNTKIPADKICFALNQRLPEDIAIQSSMEVPLDFHPRKRNSIKTYEYKILNRKMPIPLYRLNSHFVYMKLDVDKMKRAAEYLVGEHDFKSFSSARSHIEDTVRTIYALTIDKVDDMITILITGNGFLYNMVRIIVGTLMKVGLNIYPPEYVEEILDSCDRSKSGPKAPAKGLTLINIEYPEKLDDMIIIDNKYMRYMVIQREIQNKKKAYIFIKRCNKDKLISTIERNTKQAIRNRAEQVFLTLDSESLNIIMLQKDKINSSDMAGMAEGKDKIDSNSVAEIIVGKDKINNQVLDKALLENEKKDKVFNNIKFKNNKMGENILQEFRVGDFIYRYYHEMIRMTKDISGMDYNKSNLDKDIFNSNNVIKKIDNYIINRANLNNNIELKADNNVNKESEYNSEAFSLSLGNQENICLIPVTEENIEDYLSIFNESFFDVPNSMTYKKEMIMNDNKANDFFIVSYKEIYVGVVELSYDLEHIGIIESIAVKKEYEGAGIGSMMMELVQKYLNKNGCKQIELIVASINTKAINLYNKFGFQNHSIVSRWYITTKADYELLAPIK